MAVRFAAARSSGAQPMACDFVVCGEGTARASGEGTARASGETPLSAIVTAAQSPSHASFPSSQHLLGGTSPLEGRGSSTPQQQHASSGGPQNDGSEAAAAAEFSMFAARLPRLLTSPGRIASAPCSSCPSQQKQAWGGCHSPMRAAGSRMAVQRTPTKHTGSPFAPFSPLAAASSAFSPSHHQQGHQGHAYLGGLRGGSAGSALYTAGASSVHSPARGREEQRKLALSSVRNLAQLRDTVASDTDLPPRERLGLLQVIDHALMQQQTEARQQQEQERQHHRSSIGAGGSFPASPVLNTVTAAANASGAADVPPSHATFPCSSEAVRTGAVASGGGGGGATPSRLRRFSNGPLSPDSHQSSTTAAVSVGEAQAAAAAVHAGSGWRAASGTGAGTEAHGRNSASDGGSQGSVTDNFAGAAMTTPTNAEPAPLLAAGASAMELGAPHNDTAGLGAGGRMGPAAASMGVTLRIPQGQAPLDVSCVGAEARQQRWVQGTGAPYGSPRASPYGDARVWQQGVQPMSPGVAAAGMYGAHQQQLQEQQPLRHQQPRHQQRQQYPYPFPSAHMLASHRVAHPYAPHYHSYQHPHQASPVHLGHHQPYDVRPPHTAPLPTRGAGASRDPLPLRGEPPDWHMATDLVTMGPAGAVPNPSSVSSVQAVQPLQQRSVAIAAAGFAPAAEEEAGGLMFGGPRYRRSGGSLSGGSGIVGSAVDVDALDSMLENLLAEELPSLGLDSLAAF